MLDLRNGPVKTEQRHGGALTKIQVNAGNKGVDKEHEDDHGEDGHTLHQEHRVSNSVLWRRNQNGESCVSRGEVCVRADSKPTFFCSSWMFCSQFLSS